MSKYLTTPKFVVVLFVCLFVCVEVLCPVNSMGHVERGQFT